MPQEPLLSRGVARSPQEGKDFLKETLAMRGQGREDVCPKAAAQGPLESENNETDWAYLTKQDTLYEFSLDNRKERPEHSFSQTC